MRFARSVVWTYTQHTSLGGKKTATEVKPHGILRQIMLDGRGDIEKLFLHFFFSTVYEIQFCWC